MGSKLHVTIKGLRMTRSDVNKSILSSASLEVVFCNLINLLTYSSADNKTTNKYSNPMNAVVHLTSILVTRL